MGHLVRHFSLIVKRIGQYGLNPALMRGQGYDGVVKSSEDARHIIFPNHFPKLCVHTVAHIYKTCALLRHVIYMLTKSVSFLILLQNIKAC